MPLTPETLTRHELNGLPVRVVDAANPDLVGIAGRVVIETMNTLHVDTGAPRARRVLGEDVDAGGSRVRQVPKRGTTFEFALEDDRDGDGPSLENTEELGGDGPPRTDDLAGDEPARTDELDGDGPSRTDEAAGGRKAPGSASELPSETAGVRAGQSGGCEGAVYVTVDGARLLSRPALRTETTGDSKWR
ncbi:ribonuclease P protein component 1 [Halegenticoccus tardaugens]|uniref:ribonuclease P protein component 1 n=1 Tax=Halegenticoccus tardaugens TaxID=2071624 RepID=UPI00100B6E56|nr:ribonuclease P protein subunit [Halegenticoccus tardaugens]